MVATFLARKYFPTERIKKEHCKQGARDLLASLASDVDLFLDWWFLYDTHYVKTEIEREQISPALIISQLAFTIAGTFSWFALASDGRIMNFVLNMFWTIMRPLFCFNGCLNCILMCFTSLIIQPCFPKYAFTIKERIKKGRYDINRLKEIQISSGYLEFQGILLEDIPQVIITFLIDSAAENALTGNGSNTYSPTGLAVTNFLSSLYNALIKLADAYDKRNHVMTFTSVRNVLREHTLDVNCVTFIDNDDYYDNDEDDDHKKKNDDDYDYNTTKFLSGSDDNTIKLWSLSSCSKKYEIIREFKEHKSSITSITYMGNNQFVSSSVDGTMKLWNIHNEKSIRTFTHHSTSHKKGLFSIFANSSTKCCVYAVVKIDTDHFISGSGDSTIKLWNISSGQCIHTFTDHEKSVNALALIGTEHFISASSDKTIKLFNIQSKKCIRTFDNGHKRSVNSLAVLSDTTFVSGSDDGTIRLWDAWGPAATDDDSNGPCMNEYKRRYYTRSVRALCRIDENTFIAASDYRISVWRTDNTKSPIRSYTGNIGAIINTIGFTPDNNDTFITGSDDKSIRIWSMRRSGKESSSTSMLLDDSISNTDDDLSNEKSSTDDDDDEESNRTPTTRSSKRRPSSGLKSVVNDNNNKSKTDSSSSRNSKRRNDEKV